MENDLYTQNRRAFQYLEAMAPSVEEISKVFCHHFGITHFWYTRFFPGGEYLGLGNETTWTQNFYDKDLYNVPNLLIHNLKNAPLHQESSFIWDDMYTEKCVLLNELRNFNIGNIFSVVIKNDIFAETFTFASACADTQVMHFYIRHIDIIKNFCSSFKEKGSPLIQQCNLKEMPSLSGQKIFLREPEPPSWQQSITSFYQEITGTATLPYSKREGECLFHLSAGKTAKEMAREMGLSFRTVEYYIANIKKKTGHKKQTDLVRLYIEHANARGDISRTPLLQGFD